MPVNPLTVVALGGNALSPSRSSMSLTAERAAARAATAELAALVRARGRLLVVHGNGPQVGRLLAAPGVGDADHLDVHVAQTQGELGYLVAQGLDSQLGGPRSAVLVTRVVVSESDPVFQHPTKPVGPTLASPPAGVPAVPVPGGGWRRVVASPRPIAVVERGAIGTLLGRCHVVAGGGGGIPLAGPADARRPMPAVVVTDRIAAVALPITAFVAAGFEHSVANMYFVPFALFLERVDPAAAAAASLPHGVLAWSGFLVTNLLPVTQGNLIGGGALIGAVYWFVFLRPR